MPCFCSSGCCSIGGVMLMKGFLWMDNQNLLWSKVTLVSVSILKRYAVMWIPIVLKLLHFLWLVLSLSMRWAESAFLSDLVWYGECWPEQDTILQGVHQNVNGSGGVIMCVCVSKWFVGLVVKCCLNVCIIVMQWDGGHIFVVFCYVVIEESLWGSVEGSGLLFVS